MKELVIWAKIPILMGVNDLMQVRAAQGQLNEIEIKLNQHKNQLRELEEDSNTTEHQLDIYARSLKNLMLQVFYKR